MVQRYAMLVEYDGAPYAGFQRQQGYATVQAELERVIEQITHQSVTVGCAGRTDAGVHAMGQVAAVELEPLSGRLQDSGQLLHSLNSLLPPSIGIKQFIPVPSDFHPRFSCIAREYEYRIWNSPVKPVLQRDRVLWVRNPLPVEQLHGELQGLLGERNFTSFTRHEYREENTMRYVDRINLFRDEQEGLIRFQIRGNAFLHNMIRIIVGTMIDRASGKITATLEQVLEKRDRLASGQTASAAGLYLKAAYYPPSPALVGLPLLDGYPRFGNARLRQAGLGSESVLSEPSDG